MKIEFKKELDLKNGAYFYYTEKDNYFVAGSLLYHKGDAYKLFLHIVEETKNPLVKDIETLETIEL